MKSYPHGRDIAGSIIVATRVTVGGDAGRLVAFDVRDPDNGLAALCPWLTKALTPGLAGDATEEQVDAAVDAFEARAVLRSLEVVLVSGPAVRLAYTATEVAETDPVEYEAVETGYVTASPDVPVRPLAWPNLAEEHVWYWGTNGEGDAEVELAIGLDVMPDPEGSSAKFLRT